MITIWSVPDNLVLDQNIQNFSEKLDEGNIFCITFVEFQ